jgi:predicted SprT family Zn-dependent metalloprotease
MYITIIIFAKNNNFENMLTTSQFQKLDDLYRYYNVKLFGATLPECIVNLSRKPNSFGFFAANLWGLTEEDEDYNQKETVHEISLNPDYLMRPSIEWHATFVHEMVHLWQHEKGTPTRPSYHNKEWADKMEHIGLMPTSTGMPGGKRTGQKMGHNIIDMGLFYKAFQMLDPDELERLKYLPMASLTANRKRKKGTDEEGETGDEWYGECEREQETEKKKKSGTRTKYTCLCGNNIWGKSGLYIHCLDCDENYTEI